VLAEFRFQGSEAVNARAETDCVESGLRAWSKIHWQGFALQWEVEDRLAPVRKSDESCAVAWLFMRWLFW
jgi:hypothetical protein